jgi:5-methylcytosine-specific restriction enzyme A
MQTFLLTWNPKKFQWIGYDADCDHARTEGFLDRQWSCGRSKRIHYGDRIFLLRQGQEPRGIVASGIATSDEPFNDEHFALEGRSALYIKARFEVLLNSEQVFPRDRLDSGVLSSVHWDTQIGGIEIAPDAAAELEKLWRAFITPHRISSTSYAEEILAPKGFWEGALRRITVNSYERDNAARLACIVHHGPTCQVCGFDFGTTYGDIGCGFIHVHHTRPLSDIRAGYTVDPIHDLVPVCPNCHAMLHQTSPPLTIEELRIRLREP